MRTVYGGLAVVGQQLVAIEVVDVVDALFSEFVPGGTQGGAAGAMALALGWKESRIGVGAVFDQQDRGVRPAFTDTSNQRCGALGDLRCDHVGQAIDDKQAGVQFSEQVRDLRLHLAIARKSEVDDGAAQPASDDGGDAHAGAGGAGAMQDRGAVEQDRFFVTRRQRLKVGACLDADLQRFGAVVERQIQTIGASSRRQAFCQRSLDVLTFGAGDAHPAQEARSILAIQIEARVRGGRHVGHADRRIEQIVTGVDLW